MYSKPLPATTLLFLLTLTAPVGAQAGGAPAGDNGPLAATLQQAQAALKANQQAQAAELFRAVLKLDPGNVEAHGNLGALAFYHGDCPSASTEFKAALASAPTLIKAQALLAVCERRMGKPSARADLEKAFAGLDGVDAKMRTQVGIELADLSYQQGDLPRTAATLQVLSESSPDNADILFFEQRVYSELADGTLNKLAVLAPDSPRMEQLIAERLINAGDLPHAVVHYRKALARNPALPGVHFELAESLMEASPNDAASQQEAVVQLRAARDADGDSSKIECLLGRIAFVRQDFPGAQAAYGRALALDPGDPQAEIGMAEILNAQNKPAEAATYLRQAVAADPMNAEAHYKLSQTARRLHLQDEQKAQLKLFLDIRATRDTIRDLYREMNPGQPAPTTSTPTPDAQGHPR